MIQLPQKSHFKMDEVCGLTGVKPYVLRFWESEFPEIKPALSSSGQKLFSYRDVEVIYHIKQLLFEEKLNIEQAKMKLSHTQINVQSEQVEAEAETESEVSAIADHDSLFLAKEKLHMVLSLTQDIQSRHHWS